MAVLSGRSQEGPRANNQVAKFGSGNFAPLYLLPFAGLTLNTCLRTLNPDEFTWD